MKSLLRVWLQTTGCSILVLLGCVAFWLSSQPVLWSSQGLRADSPLLELHPVVEGTSVEVPVVIRNHGSNLSDIVSVTTSCGCTSLLTEERAEPRFPISVVPDGQVCLIAVVSTHTSSPSVSVNLTFNYSQNDEADNVRILFGLLRGPRLLPETLEIDINGDVAATLQVGGRPSEMIEVDHIAVWPDVVDVMTSATISKAVHEDKKRIDNTWVPIVDVKVKCKSPRTEIAGQSGIMKVFLKGNPDPIIARLNFVDRQRLSCLPNPIWLDKQSVQRRKLVITGLNDACELISTGQKGISLQKIGASGHRTFYELTLEEAFIRGATETTCEVVLDEALNAARTGRQLRITVNINSGIELSRVPAHAR